MQQIVVNQYSYVTCQHCHEGGKNIKLISGKCVILVVYWTQSVSENLYNSPKVFRPQAGLQWRNKPTIFFIKLLIFQDLETSEYIA